MEKTKKQKTDRRTLYTKQTIKEAFLRLKRNKEYNSITISDICRLAEISRSTFYLHYNHIAEVLDEVLDDAVSNIGDLINHLADTKPAKFLTVLIPSVNSCGKATITAASFWTIH